MTIQELKDKLVAHKLFHVANHMDESLEKLKDKTLEQVELGKYQGLISHTEFTCYCYAWRNLTFRYSTELSGYQL